MSEKDYDKQLGKRLRTLREMRRMTQAELGVYVGLSHQQIQKYESGTSQIRASLAMRFAELFDIDIAQLMSQATIIAIPDQPYKQAAPVYTKVAEDDTFIESNEIVKLVNAFSRIPTAEKRTVVLNLATSLSAI